ncbi:MAG TPA: hypothetical protein VFR23_04125 [Jiangellaceae bacterium]|nr:hypothetical protein [Jiangellaceae bacterium]
MSLRAFSYGGGVQSTAALVLAARGVIDFRIFLFANVGDDSEDPATLVYLAEWARPYAEANGIELHELSLVRQRGVVAGQVETLYGRLTRDGSKSLPIPVRMSNGAPGTRSCTSTYKIQVIGRWLKEHGASADAPATVGVGISLDEISRVNNRRSEPYERIVYPLLDQSPALRRQDCEGVIRSAGLPVPPKSACWFCPFHRPETWAEMRRDRPELFQRSCDLEDLLNRRRDELGKDHVYLSRFGRPLAEAIPKAQDMLPLLDQHDTLCDNGWCMT